MIELYAKAIISEVFTLTVTEIYNAVQALKPSEKQNLLAKLGVTVAVSVSKEEKQTEERFIGDSLKNGKLLAVYIEKANEMLHSIEKSYLKENTFVSFDNSIVYSMENVKYPTQKNIVERQEIMSIQDRLMSRETQDLLQRVFQYKQDKEEKNVAYIDLIGAYAFIVDGFFFIRIIFYHIFLL